MATAVLSCTVGGRRVAFARTGASACPLVLVPGCGEHHGSFDALLAAMPGADVLVPSLPGRCGSEGSALASVAQAAAWVAALLRALGVDAMVLGGHSYGGAIAQQYVLDAHAPRPRALVLMATGARLRVSPSILAHHRQRAAADGDDGEVPAATTLTDWLATDAYDQLARIHEIAVPTLLLSGSEDPLIPPKYARYLHARIPGSTLELLEGAEHFFPTERAAAVAELLLRWLP